MKNKNRKLEYWIIGVSVLLAIIFWIIHAFINYYFVLGGSFLGNLFFELEPQEWIMRVLVVFIILGIGFFSSWIIVRQKKAAKELKTSEEKYRTLFDNMINGFAFHKIVLNKKD